MIIMRTNDIKGKVTLPFCRSEEAAFCLSVSSSLSPSHSLFPSHSLYFNKLYTQEKTNKRKKAQSYWSLKKKKIGAVHRQMLAVIS